MQTSVSSVDSSTPSTTPQLPATPSKGNKTYNLTSITKRDCTRNSKDYLYNSTLQTFVQERMT